MTSKQSTSPMISDQSALERMIGRVGDVSVCAVDTEADSLHRYKESLCLIQFAWDEESLLIDPLAIEDLSVFYDFLNGRDVWMHGADYDMTMLKRECGELPSTVYDTQIGARLLGVKNFGLGNLVDHYFDVQLVKSSQKADWGKRPLSDVMVDYALNDVRYLLPMGDKIVSGLKEVGRYDWFIESCEWAKEKVMERNDEKDEPWRIQGAGRLDRAGLNYLQHLWNWRDREAEEWDRPSFMVLTNKQMIAWSQRLAEGSKVDLPKHYRPDRRRRFSEMLKEANKVSPQEYPKKIRGVRHKRDPEFDSRVAELIKRRNTIAEELGIDPSIIGSRAMIEAYSGRDEGNESQWMTWQKNLLGLD